MRVHEQLSFMVSVDHKPCASEGRGMKGGNCTSIRGYRVQLEGAMS